MIDIFADTAGWGHLADKSQVQHLRAAQIYRTACQKISELLRPITF